MKDINKLKNASIQNLDESPTIIYKNIEKSPKEKILNEICNKFEVQWHTCRFILINIIKSEKEKFIIIWKFQIN